MYMELLDPLHQPAGTEQLTQRPAWRVRMDDGQVRWAYIEERAGQVWIAGYPRYPVEFRRRKPDPAAGAVVGTGAGIVIGGALGGPPGAIIGGLLGLLLGAGGATSGKS